MYIKDVIKGTNLLRKEVLRSKTVRGYAEAVNVLFQKRSFPEPACWSEVGNVPARLIDNLAKEENVAWQRSPLDSAIFARLQSKAAASSSPDSADNVFFNLLALGRYIGPRLSEYAQTTQSTYDLHTYPSGRKVVKAFTSLDFVFYDENKICIEDMSNLGRDRAISMQVTWRVQKNRQNGQRITLAADTKDPLLCPVRNSMLLVERARRLGQRSDLPVCIYTKAKKKNFIYLTGTKVAALLRNAVSNLRPNTPKEELTKYSAHSLRVWACVLLDEQKKPPEFIKKRLRWMGDSFRMYLRDTDTISRQHLDALAGATAETSDLIAEAPAAASALAQLTLDSALLEDVPEDQEMGTYVDEMD